MNIDRTTDRDLSRDGSKLPLLSVAVVTYNQCSFLRECLESILNQDYPNIEIVVADDASPDGTQDMLREYAASGRANFVLKLADINRGITVNQGVAQAACSGKYISWMAGDDLMLPGKLSKQVSFLEANPDCALCYHDLDIFESDTGSTIRKYSDIDKPRNGDLGTLIRYGCFNGAVSNMVRASCQPDPAFDPRIPIASDWLYWMECLWSGGKIAYIDEVLGRHRRHDANVTSSSIREPSLKEVQDHLFTCDIILSRAPRYLRDINARKAYLLQSLRWHDGGRSYVYYLRASLSYRFRWKPFLGIVAATLFGKRA